MTESELLQRLSERARQEPAGEIDVAKRVVRRLSRERTPVVDRRLAVVLACACSLSAFGLGLLLTQETVRDPVTEMSRLAVRGTGPNALWRLVER